MEEIMLAFVLLLKHYQTRFPDLLMGMNRKFQSKTLKITAHLLI